MSKANLTRVEAEDIIDQVRSLVLRLEPGLATVALSAIFRSHGLDPLIKCDGEAHNPGVDIDHCMRCAPRWGQVGDRAKVGRK